ncbi:MAG: acylphosphatase [Candidatus Firestonebacteria bacterium]
MHDNSCAEITVTGRVQGVGFRAYAQREAIKLGLSGYVKNLPAGNKVFLEVEGGKEQIEKLSEVLSKGPLASSINEVEMKFSGSCQTLKGFTIRY